MINVFHIPNDSHNPPNSFNPLFDTFKQDFGESLKDNRMMYIEFSRVFMIIKSFTQLTEWVHNHQKTQAMLQLFDKQDSPKNNSIKTFKSFTSNKNNQSQYYHAPGVIPKQYQTQNQNIGQQHNFNPNFRQSQNFNPRQMQSQHINPSQRQSQSQNSNPSERQSQSQNFNPSRRQMQSQNFN